MRSRARAQITIVALWILALLSMVAVSLAHRVSLSLRVSAYYRDSLAALAAAQNALAVGYHLLAQDVNAYETLAEPWAENEELLRSVPNGEGAVGSVCYRAVDEGTGTVKTVFGMADLERRACVNRTDTLGKAVFLEILLQADVAESQAAEVGALLVNWIDEDSNEEPDFFKNKPLVVPEELLAVLEQYFREKRYDDFRARARALYEGIEPYLTVYGSGKVNANTVGERVLRAFCRAVASAEEKAVAESVALALIEERARRLADAPDQAPFPSADSLSVPSGDSAALSFLAKLKAEADQVFLFDASGFFCIEASGTVSSRTRRVRAVFERTGSGTLALRGWQQD